MQGLDLVDPPQAEAAAEGVEVIADAHAGGQ
jgi:hypothetical protein